VKFQLGCGITVVPQYGVGGYRVDFAATHPDDASRMVLAIETDGASCHQSRSVRDRDRLRGEHLQRLGWSFHRPRPPGHRPRSPGRLRQTRPCQRRPIQVRAEPVRPVR